jgi:enterochelin esterase-like enzyme
MKGRVEIVSIPGLSLEGNPWGDPTERPLVVYLPPGYDHTKARFPVLYFLHGFTGSAKGWLNVGPFAPTVPERLDALIAAGQAPPFIGAFPDGWTSLGGSQWSNSAGLGRYADYVVRDVVAEVDQHYRTVAAPRARGLIGKSSGGYGALQIGTTHPDVFGHVGCHSGDA